MSCGLLAAGCWLCGDHWVLGAAAVQKDREESSLDPVVENQMEGSTPFSVEKRARPIVLPFSRDADPL